MTVKIFIKSQVKQHNKRDDCWCIIHGKVYDLTSFLNQHPAGSDIIMKYAGTDATKAFEPVHPPDIIEKLLPPELELGVIEGYKPKDSSELEKELQKFKDDRKHLPSLKNIISLQDFELLAPKVLPNESWCYFSAGADDEITLKENVLAYRRIWLKPRVMVDVKHIDTNCKIMGYSSSLPIYITATALGKLAHPLGEVVLTKAAHEKKIIQMLPTLSSCTLKEMLQAKSSNQIQFFQLYVNSDKTIVERLIKKAEDGGCKVLCITVDAPSLGKRELDIRCKSTITSYIQNEKNSNGIEKNQGTARAISGFIDPSLNWNDISWFKKVTKMKIILKGIQCVEDAILAAQHKVDGIVISNHGGRQIDCGRSGIEILAEVAPALDTYYKNKTEKRIEILLDGGIRRGSDIFKAYALGASAVGIGRPFIYAMSTHGQEGVEAAIDILRQELEMTMRLMGAKSIKDIKREMVDISNLGNRSTEQPSFLENPRKLTILNLVKNNL